MTNTTVRGARSALANSESVLTSARVRTSGAGSSTRRREAQQFREALLQGARYVRRLNPNRVSPSTLTQLTAQADAQVVRATARMMAEFGPDGVVATARNGHVA